MKIYTSLCQTRNLVTGGAGFLGSHLIDKLIESGQEVVCIDNFFTGRKKNLEQWSANTKLEIIRHDITEPILVEVDRIWHLACPASPIHYQSNPIKTAKTSFLGTYNMLGLARRTKARIFLASTSEIYGDPEVHPQPENYCGNVNTIGIRSCYDEGKRIAESLCFDYQRMHSTEIRVGRIFNTFGPRMLKNDGRVISNFISQALLGNPITIYGNGTQTRSFCYVSDLIDGIYKLMNGNCTGPINLGNPEESTIKHIAKQIIEKINPLLGIEYKPLPEDDPKRRKPDITLAKNELNWEPNIKLSDGLDKTIEYFRNHY